MPLNLRRMRSASWRNSRVLSYTGICSLSDKEDRIKRIMKLFSLTREAAEVMLEETDKQRAEYYYKNTGKTWGDVNNYHMILNTSDLGIENCADILMRYFEMKDYI